MQKLYKYILRWQLSTPVLYLCMTYLPYTEFTRTVISNFIGALIFFPVDEWIFQKKR